MVSPVRQSGRWDTRAQRKSVNRGAPYSSANSTPFAAKLIAWYQPHNINKSRISTSASFPDSRGHSPSSMRHLSCKASATSIRTRSLGLDQQGSVDAPWVSEATWLEFESDPVGEEGDVDTPLVLTATARTGSIDHYSRSRIDNDRRLLSRSFPTSPSPPPWKVLHERTEEENRWNTRRHHGLQSARRHPRTAVARD